MARVGEERRALRRARRRITSRRPLLTSVAGLCGQGVSARITEAWSEPVILWQALVGGPSSGKTPARAR